MYLQQRTTHYFYHYLSKTSLLVKMWFASTRDMCKPEGLCNKLKFIFNGLLLNFSLIKQTVGLGSP